MREILYRAKAINRIEGREYRTNYKNGDWVYGLVTKLYDERFPNLPAEMTNTDGISDIDVDYETISEYTSLTDKNGTRIFEGDIVRMNGNDKDLAVIKYGEFGCIDVELQYATDIVLGWYYEPLPTDALSKCLPFCLPFQISKDVIERTRLEVIGNIHDNHDNPELLKGGAEE